MRRNFVLALIVLVSGVNPLFAQGGKGDDSTENIRAKIAELESELQAIEKSKLGTRRVTTIGGPRSMVRNRGMEIRIYDLGDLFAIAPPYPAEANS
ncbi:MAG: hypothetical protein KDA84_28315, partial [Planctomycetaceae bacterium]|nr:hypothetical protein [Planctomycetaceae bacterium]